jgi:hypothetical protein
MQTAKDDALIHLSLNDAVLSINLKLMTKLNQRLTYVIQKLIHFTVINYCQNVLKPTPIIYSHITATSLAIFRVTLNGLAVCIRN